MKKRVWIAVFASVLMVLCACGSGYSKSSAPAAAEAKETAAGYAMSTADYDYAAEESMEMPMATPAPAQAETANSAGSGNRAYNGDVKLIYRADLSAETTDLDKTAAEIEKLTESLGGYIESSDRSSYNYDSYVSRYAYYTVRVPQEKYNAFLDTLSESGLCTITNLSKSTTDVGAEYADTEARLKTYRIKQERLQTLLEKAETMEDIIAIESALTDVEYQIEYYSSSLNRYDALINFSTISINLQQVNRESRIAGNGTLGERIASSFSNGISAFANGFENFLIAVAGAIIPLLILAAIVIIVVIVIVRINKKHKMKKLNKAEKPQKEGKPKEE